jgi:hypothetical protein
VSLVDQLIAERREAARRELESDCARRFRDHRGDRPRAGTSEA